MNFAMWIVAGAVSAAGCLLVAGFRYRFSERYALELTAGVALLGLDDLMTAGGRNAHITYDWSVDMLFAAALVL